MYPYAPINPNIVFIRRPVRQKTIYIYIWNHPYVDKSIYIYMNPCLCRCFHMYLIKGASLE